MADKQAEKEGWGIRLYNARMSMKERTGKKMTQAELGARAGVSGTMVGYYEEETNWPGWSAWMGMAKALGYTVGFLIAGELPMHREIEHPPMPTRKTGAMEKRPVPRPETRTEKGTPESRQRRA